MRCSLGEDVRPQSSRMSSCVRARRLEQAGISTVAASERQGFEAAVERAGRAPMRPSRQALWPRAQAEPAFPDAGRTRDQQILVAVDPFAGDEFLRTVHDRGRAARA